MLIIQQGKIAEAEAASRQLWGKTKIEESLVELKSSSSEGGEEDASWGELFSKRYQKGMRILQVAFVTILPYWQLTSWTLNESI